MSSFLGSFLLLEQPRDTGTARSLREHSMFTSVRERGVRLPPGVRVEAGVGVRAQKHADQRLPGSAPAAGSKGAAGGTRTLTPETD